jgi:hypothetical protein
VKPPRWLVLALLLAGPVPAAAQRWLLVEGIADGEAWSTDSGSRLLARNDGSPALLGRVQLLAAVSVRPTLQLLMMGEIEGGSASDEDKIEIGCEQIILRYMPSRLAVFDVGRLPSPVGAFALRRLSTTNPLIGLPDGYPVNYPWGVQVSGTTSRFDYRAAVLNLPIWHEDYTPDPSAAVHPALGAGYTPIPELRIGTSVTWGPYLNSDLTPLLLAGADWKSYGERIVGFDTRFSRGYFEFRGELAFSRYEVPKQADIDGLTYYAEAKQTWGPRWYTAARVERNDYPFIRPATDSTWTSRGVDVYNAEVGAGYRAGTGMLVKASYRHAWYNIPPSQRAFLPNGYALALQLSIHVNVTDWLERRR